VDRVALLITCVGDLLTPDAVEATVKVLEAAGCEVTCPLSQTCCGQPAWNSGFVDDAARVAATTLDALAEALDEGAQAVVAPAGSCTTMMKVFWPELFSLAGDHKRAALARQVGERTFELSQYLHGRQLPALGLAEPLRVAWHHSCHMLRELHLHDEPLEVLGAVEGCEVVRWDDGERCCGFGGMFSFKLPETSVAMADDKLDTLAAAEPSPQVLAGADSSCLLHLQSRAAARGTPVEIRHLAEIVAEALDRQR
jgi:L-lactate dehydrogenase complex protein LldE